MSKGRRFLEHMFTDKLSKKPINVRNMVLQTDSIVVVQRERNTSDSLSKR